MSDRDCKNCLYARTPDDPNNNGCTAWSCEFIDRREAIKLIKSIVRCKDCKWQKVNAKNGFHGCGHRFGLVKADDDSFCPYGERKGE